ncbi:MAG: hypothetical protein ACK4FL_01775, partial [Microgenomates group bacterium]
MEPSQGSQEKPYQLPKPPAAPLTEKDWRPRKKSLEQRIFGREIFSKPPNFWQILTGYRAVFSEKDIDQFVDINGNLQLPPSELEWHDRWGKKIKGEILGIPSQEILHQSWLGVQDKLRIYVFEEGGVKEIQQRLKDSYEISNLGNLGILVKAKVPTVVKTQDGRLEKGAAPVFVFFLNEKGLQTPLDVLALTDEIAKLHPETAKNLRLHLLAKALIAYQNALNWQTILSQYPQKGIPKYLQESFKQVASYVAEISLQFDELVEALSSRLGITLLNPSFLKEVTKEVVDRSFFFKPQTEDEIRGTIERLIERAEKPRFATIRDEEGRIIGRRPLTPEEKQQKVVALVEYLLWRSFQENLSLSTSLTETLSEDPKQWLWLEVAKLGQEVLLDNLAPSEAMICQLAKKYPDPEKRPQVKSVREWLYAMGIPQEMERLWSALSQAQRRGDKKEEERIKKELAKKQEEYTNLFLETTMAAKPGGYQGWNDEVKGALRVLLETSPYFISLFQEPNCAGRMILVSGMLLAGKVFPKKDLFTMSTYDHSFLASIDAQGRTRAIEPSSYTLSHSYFFEAPPKGAVFEEKVVFEEEIISIMPLDIGLSIEAGISYTGRLDRPTASKTKYHLLKHSRFLKDNLWHNLSLSFQSQNPASLDWLLAQTRAGVICDRFPAPFYYLLGGDKFFNSASLAIKKNLSQNQFQPLLPYLKFNLLAM